MGQITLRGLDPELEKVIRERAARKGKSVNRELLDIIHEAAGVRSGKRPPAGETLRALAGGWSSAEGDEFLESIKSCEQIDEDMWK